MARAFPANAATFVSPYVYLWRLSSSCSCLLRHPINGHLEISIYFLVVTSYSIGQRLMLSLFFYPAWRRSFEKTYGQIFLIFADEVESVLYRW